MSILAYGLNYRTASVELRERVAFPADHLQDALRQIKRDVAGLDEAAIMSTCNRTELYCAIHPDAERDLSLWLSKHRSVEFAELDNAAYKHWDHDAASHQIRVASGLDSQVLGEPQIMGQIKAAYEIARECGTLGPQLNLLSQISFRAAKQVRTHTEIGRNPVSVAYAAVSLAQQIFTNLSAKKALLLGAGETIGLVADHLHTNGIGKMAIANRTLANAEILAAKYNAESLQLTDVAQRLAEYDVVIASTGSSLPIIGKGAVEAAIKQRRRRPIFMVDIAVPRDIEPEVGALPDVYLYSIDDLTQIVEGNLKQRQAAAASAETFVHEGASRYLRESRVKKDQALVRTYREKAKTIQSESLERARKDLRRGTDPEQVLERFSNDLTNKLIHGPTKAIRDASASGRSDVLDAVRTLYNLEEADTLQQPSDPHREH